MTGKEYIKLPEEPALPDRMSEIRKTTDESWKRRIFCHILKFYKEVDTNKVIEIIRKEKEKRRAGVEKTVKMFIKIWLRNSSFASKGYRINSEADSDGDIPGHYDLKIEHSGWTDKYFAFECKNLDASSNSVNEYVYNKSKKDGGMYRYMINKYACDLNFGGMIGFIIKGKQTAVIESIIEKIYTVYNKGDLEGQLSNDAPIIRRSIEDNPNTFDSIHLRPLLNDNKKQQNFTLHHILMDFSENSVYKRCDKTRKK